MEAKYLMCPHCGSFNETDKETCAICGKELTGILVDLYPEWFRESVKESGRK